MSSIEKVQSALKTVTVHNYREVEVNLQCRYKKMKDDNTGVSNLLNSTIYHNDNLSLGVVCCGFF